LRTESRIGKRAYVTAGAPIAGGTLARDVTFLTELAAEHGLLSPLMLGIRASNQVQMEWIRDRVSEATADLDAPCVALLGLTYKPGTDTLRRSAAVDLAHWLNSRGAVVRAYDPAIRELPSKGPPVTLASGIDDALRGADVAVLATPWPEFRELDGDRLVRLMRRPYVVDQVGFVPHLAGDNRVRYVRVGRPLASLVHG
jgi:UDPglucose 6-dehydrogenase